MNYWWECFEEQKKGVKELVAAKIQQFSRKTEEDILKEGKKASEKFWKLIASMQAQSKGKTDQAPILRRNGKDLEDKGEAEDWLIEYFTQRQDLKRTPEDANSVTKTTESKKGQEHSIMDRITRMEMTKQIKRLENRKTTGTDNIPNEFIKSLEKEAQDGLRTI